MLVLAIIVVSVTFPSTLNQYAGAWTTVVFVEACVFLGPTFIPKVKHSVAALLSSMHGALLLGRAAPFIDQRRGPFPLPHFFKLTQ